MDLESTSKSLKSDEIPEEIMKQISLKKRYIGTGPNQIEPKNIQSAKKSFWKQFDQLQMRTDHALTILEYHNEKYKDAKYKLDQNSSK